MSSCYGNKLKLQIFGQSHSEGIGVVMDGIPAGKRIDFNELYTFMQRRAPGNSATSTARKEADRPELLSGVVNGVTCGAPIAFVIRNTDTRSGDYDELRDIPRPSHADYAAFIKYGEFHDIRGGGHFSGRLTAPLCTAGGVCLQILKTLGISITARIVQIGTVTDNTLMEAEILKAKQGGDSIGGVIECVADGVPAGLGEPIFGGIENKIAGIVFGIPGIKGIEFGNGFDGTRLSGFENNDAFLFEDGRVKTRTNNCGGILGGITNGMPIIFRTAVKPTPSIAKEQQSISLSRKENTTIRVKGRHDPCIVPRAVPCIEAAAAIAVYDAYLEGGSSV